eukprot:Protomagalhaensia_sp_Gyna_25__4934@NODE_530_length_3197_cov_160_852438_g414_i0_p2_GENE_NODE_530_length_3197_cov_160_852438_g414_i0NODE_530_length_3197_cov_160_852438_g414_i0_p2_ORF_typecomplete_len310_score30_52YL1/PF05764_13/1_6e06YL1/PF05764_13/0_028YL1_C/PF08265_11/0_018_NODE_530_length_3197_cov_160_852438_g414_i021063035
MEESVSESGSLKLVTSSSSDESNGLDEGSSSEELRLPPSIRELPQRSTRGRRLGGLVNTDEDTQFWEHETWREEADDDEWKTDDEGRYKDKFDSDFLSTESEDEGLIDKAIEFKEFKKFDYQKIALRRQQRKENSKRIWSSFEIEKEYYKNPLKFKKKPLFQIDHLRISKETEEINNRILIEYNNIDKLEINKNKKYIDNQRLNGNIEYWISYINKELNIEEQLLFFINQKSPSNSSIPSIYSSQSNPVQETHQCSVFPHLKAKYQDPVTLKWYSGPQAFNIIRQQTFKLQLEQVSNVLQKTLESIIDI